MGSGAGCTDRQGVGIFNQSPGRQGPGKSEGKIAMGSQATWDRACERMAARDRTLGDANGRGPGIGPDKSGKGQLDGEMSVGRWGRGARGRVKAFQSSRAQTRNPAPHTGKGPDNSDRIHTEYDDATNRLANLARTRRHRELIGQARSFLAECSREAQYRDVPTVRLERLARELRQAGNLLAGVTTGDVDRAVVIGRGIAKIGE